MVCDADGHGRDDFGLNKIDYMTGISESSLTVLVIFT